MNNRFKREMYEFLVQDDISLETNIVNDFMYRMAGVEPTSSEGRSTGFYLGESWDKNEDIRFNVPNLKMPALRKLLQFLHVPEDEFETNKPLVLNPDFVLNTLLPEFKSYYKSVKANAADELKPYILESKGILESSAVNTLNRYTQKAIDTVLADQTPETSDHIGQTVDALLLLNAKVENLSRRPILYKSIIAADNKINDVLQYAEIMQNKALGKQLDLVRQGIALFTRYNRCESVLANQAALKQMEQFLSADKYKIAISQCDVIERTLMRLCNAELGVNGKCRRNIGQDASRFVLHFDDMNQENANRIINYLKAAGDETAIEGSGFGKYGSSIPESAMSKSVNYGGYGQPEQPIVERHHIEIDGKFFLETILPRLQHEIIAMETSAPDVLQAYREKSRAYFEKCCDKTSKIGSFFKSHFGTPDFDALDNEDVVRKDLSSASRLG